MELGGWNLVLCEHHRITALIQVTPAADSYAEWFDVSIQSSEKIPSMSVRRPLLTLLFLPLVLLAACRESKVTAYRVPKEKDPELPMAAADAASTNDGSTTGPPVATPESAGLTWIMPDRWKAKPALPASPMFTFRSNYAVPGEGDADAELSITAFPNDVGGEAANLNRWRGQIQLPPLQEADLAGAVTRLEQNGLPFAIVDFPGAPGANAQRILGAIVTVNGGATWFFKLKGPAALVAKEKPAFDAFLKTVKAAGP
jgi:hypothetical protein